MNSRILQFVAASIIVPAAVLSQSPAHMTLAPSGNEARFIVRESLAGASLPNDAIGVTHAITGELKFGADGKVDPSGSKFTVQMTTLTSDQARRDNWIRRNTLKTDSFPTSSFVVRELQGFPAKLPATGSFTFKMLGDFTVHGITKPWSWDVTLAANGSEYSGRATTHLKFGDFGMEQPRVMVVLSVVDDIKLEYDFHFLRQ